ncbi:hypothetical protein [Fodinibius sp. AD559]|uniref:hypothetical protein n=1 Tax=Fodinibius sp. AD559 TaxID=3424179 RepID=UPI004046E402
MKKIKSNPSNQPGIVKSSISIGHLLKQVDEINRQYHDFNKLHLSVDDFGQCIQINYMNDDGIDTQLTSWLDMGQVGTFLQNYQRMFCLDPNRLDRFFDITEATAILPICWLRPTRKRVKGISNAFIYMRQAYQRVIPRRKPISARPNKEGNGLFDIIDGNSTYFVAKQIGMKTVPVELNR